MTILQFSKDLAQDIVASVRGVEIPVDDRTRISGALFDILHEHHQAVLLLISRGLIGSAGALIRSILEAYVRGVWFMKCASDEDVRRFSEKDEFKKGTFHDRVQEIANVDSEAHAGLMDVKRSAWTALNSYAHGGFRPVVRRLTESEVKSNYSEEEVREIEKVANSFAILGVFQIAELAGNKELLGAFKKMVDRFNENYS